MTMSWSPCHLEVWPNSRSKDLPVGGTTLSGRASSPVKVPVALVTTVIQSPAPLGEQITQRHLDSFD
jgi:hypothetical protein